MITAPQQSIAQRKARTQQLRDRFNDIESQFAVLDNLILRFNTTPADRDLIAAYQASRIIRDPGNRPTKPTAPPPPPGPSSAGG